YRLGNYKKAVLELERAVQIRPEDPIINDHLGDAYWRVGRELEARFQWQRSLSLKPDAKFDVGVRKKLKEGLPPAKPLDAPSESGGTNDPDKT
ncbi:MAG: tetratricopeptide repeat protein, partial [Rhodospirillales bacterium]|nr:tetratricopeptide repeat protein [Rhodospirillales bacterium]